MKLLHGETAGRLVSERIGAPVASLSVLKQIPADRRVDGQIFHVKDSNTYWQFERDATCNGDDLLAVKPNDNPSTGRFMRMPGAAMLAVPFYATTPSGTALLTVPSNTLVQIDGGSIAIRVSRVFTGVATAVAGLSSSNLFGHTGPYNIAGSAIATQLNNYFSATGNGTGAGAALIAPLALGAQGVASGAVESPIRPLMKGGDTLRQDGGGWGTGVGEWLVACQILQNPGL